MTAFEGDDDYKVLLSFHDSIETLTAENSQLRATMEYMVRKINQAKEELNEYQSLADARLGKAAREGKVLLAQLSKGKQ